MNPFFWIPMLFVPALSFASERVRHVECHHDQIVTVRTALGIATIIQLPDRPNSVVVGDQAKFKVEYLDQAITIKPLQAGAKSNLYVYTDYQRYNVQLITGPESSSDYVVYLDNIKAKVKEHSVPLKWTPYLRAFTNSEITFETKRLGHASDGIYLVEFRLKARTKITIKPEWIWLVQGNEPRPIQSLFLSTAELNTGEHADGVIEILGREIDPTRPLRIEMRRQKTTLLTLPKVTSWK